MDGTAADIRVLVIEDDTLLRDLMAARLQKAGFSFDILLGGAGALEKVAEFQPTIVLLDLTMPGKDGFAVLTELKSSEHKDIPVVIFSNSDGTFEQNQAVALGAAGFYVKALTNLAELVTLIKKHSR